MANVTYTVSNKNGSYDGDMVVKQYTTVNVDSGDYVTTDQPCRGMFLLATGNFTVDGTISMTSKGALANPTSSGGSDSNSVDSNGLRFPFVTSGGSSSLTAADTLLNGCGTTARSVIANFKTLSSDGTILSVVRLGANGGAGASPGTGTTGSNGSTGQSGGGGSGASNHAGTSGAGAYGSCFSGGSGGGPIDNNGSGTTAGTNWGGAGGTFGSGHNAGGTGGAGNPKGANVNTGGSSMGFVAPTSANNISPVGGGTGGLIVIVVGGNVAINASGKILANGGSSDHITGANDWLSTGGAAGGGNIIIAHRGTYTNNGTVTANGGIAGKTWNDSVGGSESSGTHSNDGGSGGNGSVQVLQIS